MPRLTWDETDLTHDAFLGGRLHLLQPRRGFRAGIDAVLLASAVPAGAGDTVLELGAGVGTASLCLANRIPKAKITGVELQSDYARLAQQNAASNGLECTFLEADLSDLPSVLRQMQFSHVMMNPPYFDRTKGQGATDNGRETALGEGTPLSTWIDVGIRRLAPKGSLTVIQRIERLPDVLTAVYPRLGSIRIKPICSRIGRPPKLFLLRGILAGRAPFAISSSLTMHEGVDHTDDKESYTPEVSAILRNGAALGWTD